MTDLATTTSNACSLCGGRELAELPRPQRTVGGPLGTMPGLGLRRCRSCGFEFVDPRPDDHALAGFYQAQDYTAHEPVDDAAARQRAAHQLTVIARAGGKLVGAALLDVGCGGGQLLVQARALGAHGCGVDPAEHAHAACRRHGLEVVAQLDDLGARRFDGIVMSHVLEHVPDVLATLRWLHELLHPEGWLCLEVPNRASLRARLSAPAVIRLGADERHRAFPIHLSYFSPATLRRALTATGYAVTLATSAGLGVQALLPRRSAPASSPSATPSSPPASSPSVSSPSSPPSVPPAATRATDLEPPAPRARGLVGFAREQAKRRYFDALLGENLIVVARRR